MGMVADWIKDAVSHLIGSLKEHIGGMFGKLLATFGLTTVTWSAVLPNLKAFVVQQTGGITGPAADMLGYLRLGEAISMILSALTIRLAWKVFIVPKSVADTIGGGS
jgi:hypothetical protein